MGTVPASPVARALVGAVCISSSAILVQLSHSPAGTTGFYRCTLALPGLFALSLWERRRAGARNTRDRLAAFAAGIFLGVDLVLWAHAIYDVGAGIATVLGNLQVLFVTLIAWLALRERPRAQFLLVLPVVLTGVALAAGLIGRSPSGDHPLAGVAYGFGTSISYAVFILLLRRNAKGSDHVAGPLLDATAGAAAASLGLGLVLGQMNFGIPLRGLGWLAVLALTSQTVGWLLITSSLPHLPAAVSSLLLLLQPAAALLLAAVVLSERPSAVQVLGAAMVCGGVLVAARMGKEEIEPVPG